MNDTAQPTVFVLAPGEESKPIDFGFRSAAGRVVVAATDVNSLYVSSFKIGNKDMNISGTGPGEPLSNYPTDELGFSGGNTEANVPEPGTVPLLGFGLLALTWYGWHSRKRVA